VRGRRREIDAAGPKPGRTPTNVPTRQPRKHRNIFAGSSAILKAREKFPKKSIQIL
jgi:hypothetical protein